MKNQIIIIYQFSNSFPYEVKGEQGIKSKTTHIKMVSIIFYTFEINLYYKINFLSTISTRCFGLAVNSIVIESFFLPCICSSIKHSSPLAYDLEFTCYIEEFKGLRGKK